VVIQRNPSFLSGWFLGRITSETNLKGKDWAKSCRINCEHFHPFTLGARMKTNWYSLVSNRFVKIEAPHGWSSGKLDPSVIFWVEIDEPDHDGLSAFLSPLTLHPLHLSRCLDTAINPTVLTVGETMFMEYPASLTNTAVEQTYLSILLRENLLITIRRGSIPEMEDFIQELIKQEEQPIEHLPQVIYMLLDHFADLNVDAQIAIRDRILELSKTIKDTPEKVNAQDISNLRWQVENLISLIENQLYCVSRLAAADLELLRDPHRKAYIDDIVSESEIARQGVYRLENRVDDLFNDYQMIGSDRVERRLRLLTIVSAITLPLGLIAGLLGMNVGGVPGINLPTGFIIVLVLMVVIGLIQFIYFKKHGWFD
jgi:magnesium transporter